MGFYKNKCPTDYVIQISGFYKGYVTMINSSCRHVYNKELRLIINHETTRRLGPGRGIGPEDPEDTITNEMKRLK